MLRRLVQRFALALLVLPSSATADSTALVTILEGEVALVRGTTRHAAAEGVRLEQGDIIHTAGNALVRLEFTDGSIMDLGQNVRLLTTRTAPRGSESDPGWQHTLLSGAVKLTDDRQSKLSHHLSTPHLALTTSSVVAVVLVSPTDASIYIESGEARLTEPVPKGRDLVVRLKGGDFYMRRNGQKGTVAPRPPQGFIGGLPRGFLDTIPSRSARFKGRQVAPRKIAEVDYDEVEIWLKADRDLRRSLLRRWLPRARDREFRRALVANLRHHPEWDPVLFPEKYRPKEEKPAPGVTP